MYGFESLRLVKRRSWIKVAIIITQMLAQKSELRERLVAHVLPFQTFRIQVSGSLYQVS